MIVGAGLAGLIAAHGLPGMPIIDRNATPSESHKALLRFRSTAVADLTGIEFRPVTVRKGIWMDGQWIEPNIACANHYSRKVIGKLVDRSIWQLSPETRWIAPLNFYDQLIDSVANRIEWGVEADWESGGLISTAPLPVMLNALKINTPLEFKRAPITVRRWLVDDCDAHQTVYYPTPHHNLYRASITGNLLIAEYSGEDSIHCTHDLLDSFALDSDNLTPFGESTQDYGKIAAVDEGERKALISKLTVGRDIFCIGRYGTWRNILLDDVVHDVAVVKRLMKATNYERRLAAV